MKARIPLLTLALFAIAALALFGFTRSGSSAAAHLSLKGLALVKGQKPVGNTRLAAFSGGCFWGVEDSFRHVKGVVATEVGFTGGHVKNPSYEEVCTHTTGHLETVLVEYDPKKTTYRKLVDAFWSMHDPTQADGQGPDIGEQYHSAIWCYSPEQEKEAAASRNALQKSGKYGNARITTHIAMIGPFYKAEDYHQQYAEKNGFVMCKVHF